MTLIDRLLERVRREAHDTLTLLLPPQPPQVGLYTFDVELPDGRRRLHLRVEEGGWGLLFVDVTDVIRLNPTATEMAKLALEGMPQERARALFLRRYQDVTRSQLDEELARIYTLVNHLREFHEGCPTCGVTSLLEFSPLFSTPVSAPYKADLALTYACNNACPHCYNEPERFEMDSLDGEGWSRVLGILAGLGVPHVILTGGEPTLHPDLSAIVHYGETLGLIMGMNTNGRRLSHLPTMRSLVEAGLDHVQITLESSRADVHNAMVGATAFGQTVQGIENALASDIHTITNTTLTGRNADHALEIVDFLHNLGLETFAMNGMIYAGGGLSAPDAIPAEEMITLLTAVRDRAEELEMRFLWYTVTDYCRLSPVALGLPPKRCNAAEYSICIEPNGDVLPCQSYYVAAGNILTDPWEEIWQSELFRSFRDREENPEAAGLPRACWDCPDLPMCGGGCRLEREAGIGRRAAEGGCGRARAHPRQSTISRSSPRAGAHQR